MPRSASKMIEQIRHYSTLNQRLSEIMRSKAMNITELAAKAKVAVGTIQKLLTDPSCNPTIASLESISNVLDVSISELIGQDEKLNALRGTSILLLEWEDLPSALGDAQSLAQLKDKRSIVKTACSVSDQAFALKMQGNSMLPLFPENSILIFDPHKHYCDNSYILVQTKNHEGVLFKQILIDEPIRYIKSINPIFAENITKLEKGDKILASLVQSQMQF